MPYVIRRKSDGLFYNYYSFSKLQNAKLYPTLKGAKISLTAFYNFWNSYYPKNKILKENFEFIEVEINIAKEEDAMRIFVDEL